MTMEQIAAPGVAVRDTRAETRPIAALRPGDRPEFAPLQRWSYLDLVTGLRKALRLTANDIAVLRALLSFLPVKGDAPVTPDMLTVVFASNDQISRRAAGLDERVLRHCFARLTRAGLLQRRDSATGKRFPLRAKGRIVDAFGLDLAPGFVSRPLLQDMADRQAAEDEERATVRSRLLAARKALTLRLRDLDAEVREWLETLGTQLRRKLPLATLETLALRLEEVARGLDTAEEIAATDGGIYRHKESEKIDSNILSPTDIDECWRSCTELSAYFPDAPRDASDLRLITHQFSKALMLRNDAMTRAIARLGWIGTLKAMDRLARNALKVRDPSAYLSALIDDNALHRGSAQGASCPRTGLGYA